MTDADAIKAAVAAAERALVAKVVRILKDRPFADARELVPDVEALVDRADG